jgi:hypothetical protein
MSTISMNRAVNLALTAGMFEFAFKVLNAGQIDRKWGLVGQQLDIWIDYPQAVAAGFVALSFFGRGILGYTTAGFIIITPLALKVCREFQFANPGDNNDYTDVSIRDAETLLGVVIKIINITAAIRLIMSESQNSWVHQTGKVIALTIFLSARVRQLFATGF